VTGAAATFGDGDDVPVEVVRRLDSTEVARVAVLVERATEVDGTRPLSEHVTLHLRHGGDTEVRHVLAYQGDRLLAYAHLDVTDPVEGPSAELVVDPEARGHGIGHRMVKQLLAESPDGRLRLWSHGGSPAAAALAHRMGFTRTRALWQMRRSLYAPLPAPVLPEGVSVRTFRPRDDDEAWLAVNARAFVDHPEQGRWTVADLRNREQEPWFDAAGFFLATRPDPASPTGDRVVGFHWTKVHGAEPHTHDGHGHDAIGEVYVVGVDPSEQGTGLGQALTLVGLAHLRAAGLPDAMLYVDEDNTHAIRLYEHLGFTRWDTDVVFSAPERP
jgi:mycothiol synthase